MRLFTKGTSRPLVGRMPGFGKEVVQRSAENCKGRLVPFLFDISSRCYRIVSDPGIAREKTPPCDHRPSELSVTMKERPLAATVTVTPGSILRDATETPIRAANPSQTEIPETSMQESIAKLAHALWEHRGSPYGSPEADWFEAEQQLLGCSAN